MKGVRSRFVVRTESGAFLVTRSTVREAERECRKAAREFGRAVVEEQFEDDPAADEIVMMVEFELPRTVRVTRHGRYADA